MGFPHVRRLIFGQCSPCGMSAQFRVCACRPEQRQKYVADVSSISYQDLSRGLHPGRILVLSGMLMSNFLQGSSPQPHSATVPSSHHTTATPRPALFACRRPSNATARRLPPRL